MSPDSDQDEPLYSSVNPTIGAPGVPPKTSPAVCVVEAEAPILRLAVFKLPPDDHPPSPVTPATTIFAVEELYQT